MADSRASQDSVSFSRDIFLTEFSNNRCNSVLISSAKSLAFAEIENWLYELARVGACGSSIDDGENRSGRCALVYLGEIVRGSSDYGQPVRVRASVPIAHGHSTSRPQDAGGWQRHPQSSSVGCGVRSDFGLRLSALRAALVQSLTI